MSVAAPTAAPATVPAEMTVADLAARFGSLPASRIRTDVPPGTATEADIERVRCDRGVLCELIDGVLVEKAVCDKSAILAMELGRLIGNLVASARWGWISGADGFTRLFGTRLRAPDVSFIRHTQRPNGPLTVGYADGAPALAVEVVSPGNTRREMEEKRAEYFANGAEAVWIVDPESETIAVWTGAETVRSYTRGEVLSGDPVLPGFTLDVAALFDAVAPPAEPLPEPQP